jgi:hypothetical protein
VVEHLLSKHKPLSSVFNHKDEEEEEEDSVCCEQLILISKWLLEMGFIDKK